MMMKTIVYNNERLGKIESIVIDDEESEVRQEVEGILRAARKSDLACLPNILKLKCTTFRVFVPIKIEFSSSIIRA
jgi:hypothetical protein